MFDCYYCFAPLMLWLSTFSTETKFCALETDRRLFKTASTVFEYYAMSWDLKQKDDLLCFLLLFALSIAYAIMQIIITV